MNKLHLGEKTAYSYDPEATLGQNTLEFCSSKN